MEPVWKSKLPLIVRVPAIFVFPGDSVPPITVTLLLNVPLPPRVPVAPTTSPVTPPPLVKVMPLTKKAPLLVSRAVPITLILPPFSR